LDLKSLEIEGAPVPVVEGLTRGQFDISADGSLVYVTGEWLDPQSKFEWIDREGARTPARLPQGNYQGFTTAEFRLSPDGRSLAYSVFNGKEADIWIYDLVRNVPTRLTFTPGREFYPVWHPSGESIVFAATGDKDVPNIVWQRVDGTGEAQRLTDGVTPRIPESWHPEGHLITFRELTPEGRFDLKFLEVESDGQTGLAAGKITNFLATPFDESESQISPDGNWLAYKSHELGQPQIFVQRFPEGGGKKRISIDGIASYNPRWSGISGELHFITHTGGDEQPIYQWFSAGYSIENESIRWEQPQLWSDEQSQEIQYDLHPDGQRQLVRSPVADPDEEKEQLFDHVVLFENFFEYLRTQVPLR
jgi:dipeptidyl aminopeptidase/acylaminoacyl peptidase